MYKYIFILLLIFSVQAQTTGKISGTIYDDDKNPLLGANI